MGGGVRGGVGGSRQRGRRLVVARVGRHRVLQRQLVQHPLPSKRDVEQRRATRRPLRRDGESPAAPPDAALRLDAPPAARRILAPRHLPRQVARLVAHAAERHRAALARGAQLGSLDGPWTGRGRVKRHSGWRAARRPKRRAGHRARRRARATPPRPPAGTCPGRVTRPKQREGGAAPPQGLPRWR